jgi:hypothetical protein
MFNLSKNLKGEFEVSGLYLLTNIVKIIYFIGVYLLDFK